MEQNSFVQLFGTRMGHFLDACKRTCKMLPALYDCLYTTGAKKEERDMLFSPPNVYTLLVLADITDEFKGSYLRKLIAIVSQVYNIAQKSAAAFANISTPEADNFLQSLNFEDNGNLKSDIAVNENTHIITLQRYS